MATVKEVVTDALEEINYQAAEEPVAPADGQTGMRYLNDMLTMWDALGVSLGFTKVKSMGDEVTVADGALYGIKKLLALSLAPKFDSTVTPLLIQEAKQGWEAIMELSVFIQDMVYPSILPLGSGNYYGPFESKYYPNLQDAIYTETEGFIAIEDNT